MIGQFLVREVQPQSFASRQPCQHAQVGRVLDALDASGCADDTFVLFTPGASPVPSPS